MQRMTSIQESRRNQYGVRDASHSSVHHSSHHATTNITFKIGGKTNRVTAIELCFNVQGTAEELQTLFNIIKEIEKLHIFPSHIIKANIETLTTLIKNLIDLNCMSDAKESVKEATIIFLQTTLNNMSHHPLELDHPGYEAYKKELIAIHSATIFINQALYRTRIKDSSCSLTFQKPTKPRDQLTQLQTSKLPSTLPEFFKSIEDTDACKTTWEEHFRTVDSQLLSTYFNHIISMLRDPSTSESEVDSILNRLTLFAEGISRRSTRFRIQILLDVIKEAKSQKLTPLKHEFARPAYQSTPKHTKALNTLKKQIEKLFTPNTPFNNQFHAFRHTLSRSLKHHPYYKPRMLDQLQIYVMDKDNTNEQVQTIQQYINRCIIRLSEPLPTHLTAELARLRARYENTPTLSRQHSKLIFLNAWVESIAAHPEKTYSECYRLTCGRVTRPVLTTVNRRDKHRFFLVTYNFRDFINGVLQTEPDYERTHQPTEQATTTEPFSNLTL